MIKQFISKIKQIIETIKIILKSKSYIIYTLADNNILCKFVKHTDKINESTYVAIVNDIKQSLIDDICQGNNNEYSKRLEIYDPDLCQAFKEIEYLNAKLEYIEADHMYYKDMNTVNNGITADTAFKLYERVQQLKQRYLEIEKLL